MNNLALGYACNFKDLFVRFSYKSLRNLYKKYRIKQKRYIKAKQILIDALELIIADIVENNVTFKFPGCGYKRGEMHYEAVRGELFRRQKRNGKFEGIDFLETLFTGYLMYFYVKSGENKWTYRKKVPVYINRRHTKRMWELANLGKAYC